MSRLLVILSGFFLPHIAAEESGVTIKLNVLSEGLAIAAKTNADIIFVEGAGGWRVPLVMVIFI